MKNNIKKAKGSALVVALLAAMAISITSASLLHQVITESRATEREVAAQQAYYLANAAVERAIYELAYGEDILDDNGNSGSNGLPDLYEQLHGLNSFSTAYGGPGPYVNPPLIVTFDIAGRTTTVELVSILPQHQNMLETFDPNKSSDAYLPLLGSCYGKPIFEDLNNDGRSDLIIRFNESDDEGLSQTVRLLTSLL